jgi:hypothetical protein
LTGGVSGTAVEAAVEAGGATVAASNDGVGRPSPRVATSTATTTTAAMNAPRKTERAALRRDENGGESSKRPCASGESASTGALLDVESATDVGALIVSS